jgi:arsenite-transporting ATPase
MVDGVTVAIGSYPNRERLLSFAGLAGEAPAPDRTRPELGLSEKSGGCCGGSTGCC